MRPYAPEWMVLENTENRGVGRGEHEAPTWRTVIGNGVAANMFDESFYFGLKEGGGGDLVDWLVVGEFFSSFVV